MALIARSRHSRNSLYLLSLEVLAFSLRRVLKPDGPVINALRHRPCAESHAEKYFL